MKKRIAVFGNGWNNLALEQAINGIKSVTDKLNIDIFLFLSFATFNQTEARVRGEDSIFDLPDYSDFDGAIVFSNMLNTYDVPCRISKKLVEQNVLGVSVGLPMEGLSFVGIDNRKGMYEMVEHLVKEHHIKNPVFFAGTREHPDSIERLEVTKQALAENGIKLPKENIRYTDWEYMKSMKFAMELCKKENPPDAYICANDYNAIAACVGLEKMGYSVPKDAIVTGFDKIAYADTFYPSITTVYQDYEKLGYIAAWLLVEKMHGTATSDSITVSTKFVRNESCGCKKESDGEIVRHKFCISSYTKEMEGLVFQGHEVDFTSSIFNCTSYDVLKKNLLNFYQTHHTYNHNDLYCILDSEAKKTLLSSTFPVPKGFSNKMICLVAVKKDVASYVGEFSRKELIPGYKKGKKPVIYALTSMHFDDNVYGYIVLSNPMKQIKDTTLNHFMFQVNFNIDQFRKNCRLEEMNKALRSISNTDQLTGLNNRFGMEYNGMPLMEKAHKKKKSCAVIFTDINRMKHINDNFGHLQGDLAIRTVASAILTEIPEGWIGIRYGGDEFIALGVCDDKKIAEDYILRIQNNLKKQVDSMHLAYSLSVSCGYILTAPSASYSLIDYINQADSIMYEEKQKTYKK